MTKYARYQDYVIRDGRLVGEFEQMYRDFDEPWHQSKELTAPDKALTIHFLKNLGVQRVMELGCGLAQFAGQLADAGFETLGVDISETAIAKARRNYPAAKYATGDFLDFHIYRAFKPQAVVMAEITWYVLDKLDRFLSFMRDEMRDAYLVHLLVTYPPGVQKYGSDKFTSLKGVMDYFGMKYLEWGELRCSAEDTTKTYFVGRFHVSE